MDKIIVIYKGKEYMIIHQFASGYCEIAELTKGQHEIELVHFSELTLTLNK
ncbi:hypothetical protein L1999_12405 [Neobacillus drentensis]|uniref:hypothetical protein n=1 Tax=Neobacillus drentensis TaxID=220684 RepID=UPI001F2B68A0|nr:hypothetical protein [Neobacillus drentensis]ULT59273.1 hypothetical protein L1999_12405 [Neobacillus drentensis]